MTVSAQFVYHRLRFVFAGDIINADIRTGVTKRERDRASDSRACSGDNRLLAFEQFAIFGFRNDRLRQIHEILRIRHFRFRTISCFRWHGWHKILIVVLLIRRGGRRILTTDTSRVAGALTPAVAVPGASSALCRAPDYRLRKDSRRAATNRV